MSIYDRLALHSSDVQVTPESTSYFSEPDATLDPHLFEGEHLRPWVRQGILSLLYGYWQQHYRDAETWSTVWIAGSGASHQWSASRDPGDLDVLVGVDMVRFRQANPDFVGLSDAEIADHFNDEFRADLMPGTAQWHGYEMTFYVNQGAADITAINPYAAYNVSDDTWTVRPDPAPHAPDNPVWASRSAQDAARAQRVVQSYDRAVAAVSQALSPGHRLNAEVGLRTAAQEASDLFDEIHEGRHAAFERGGLGYADEANYRWQAGKASGAVPALKKIRDSLSRAQGDERVDLYGDSPLDPRKALILSALSRRWYQR